MSILFSSEDNKKLDEIAKKANAALAAPKATTKVRSINTAIIRISEEVVTHFKDSSAICITSEAQLHSYIDKIIDAGICAVDFETTGLDVINDVVVGSSLYYPGGVECYIPNKHLVPIFDIPYDKQLSYLQVGRALQRLVDAKVKLVFANADFDMSFAYKDYGVDFCDAFYYDVILAWRCIKENEKNNRLKLLYNKYVLKGAGDPKSFSDFFPINLFPYCDPEVAKLYAANDARITYDLYRWQLPYITPDHPKCIKHDFGRIAELVWGLEMPLVPEIQRMHRRGMYLDAFTARQINNKYIPMLSTALVELKAMVLEIVQNREYRTTAKCPFRSADQFNPDSPQHVAYLLYDLMRMGTGNTRATGKAELEQYNHPVVKQILYCRSLSTIISTFVEKLPKSVASDQRIHCQFMQIGADTGRLSSRNPNMQNIPSKMADVRRMFRASPGYTTVNDAVDDRPVFDLNRWETVKTPIGDKCVDNLERGDTVSLFVNNQEVWMVVDDISNSDEVQRLRIAFV